MAANPYVPNIAESLRTNNDRYDAAQFAKWKLHEAARILRALGDAEVAEPTLGEYREGAVDRGYAEALAFVTDDLASRAQDLANRYSEAQLIAATSTKGTS